MFTWLSVLASRIHAVFARGRFDADFDSEVRGHLDMLTEENTRRGMTREEAIRAARIALGGVTQLKESNRERRGLPQIETLLKDLRYAGRMLVRSPGFTAMGVLTLALGIGLNTTLFTAVNAVALRPLPVKDADNLVRMERWFESGSLGNGQYAYSYPEYIFYRDQNRSFSSVIAVSFIFPALADLPRQGSSLAVHGQLVSGDYFSDLGAGTTVGRTFLKEENETPGAHPVIVLSHRFWQRAFNSDPLVLGKTIALNGTPCNVVGVTSEEFLGTANPPQVPDFWAPLMMQAQLEMGQSWLDLPLARSVQILGRLKPGTSATQAQADVTVLANQFGKTYPPDDKTTRVTLEHARFFGGTNDIRFQAFVALLMAVVGMVLLIACANLANMLLARAGGRRKEIAVRLALGASRGRVVRQLLTESMLLGLLGGVAGLFLSMWASKVLWTAMARTIQGFFWSNITFVVPMTPDLRVFMFTLLLALITGVIFGLAPALQLTRPELRIKRSRLRSFLVASQVAVSMVLLISAGLLVRGLLKSQVADPGFETRSVFMVFFDRGVSQSDAATLQKRVLARLAELPELRSVALVNAYPLTGTWTPPMMAGSVTGRTLANRVGPSYFETLGVPILAGRNFTEQESERAAPLAVISESGARKFWPGESPLGKRFKLDMNFRGQLSEFQVIGVAKDVRTAQLSRVDPSYVYLTDTSAKLNGILIRTRGDAKTALAAVRGAIEGVDRTIPPSLSMISLEDGPLRLQKLMTGAYTAFAVLLATLALSLAAVGIYGVMACLVSQRVREIGIQMALGATGSDVLKRVVGRGLRPVFIGAALGLTGAAGVSSLVRGMLVFPGNPDMLYGVSVFDPVTFVGLSCFMAVVALVASWVPARRAVRVDPVVALRWE
jgi:predicted permease